MASKVVDFYEMFSKEDLKIARGVYRTYNCQYVPVVLYAPEQTDNYVSSYLWLNEFGNNTSAWVSVYTTKLAYAIQVWLIAISSYRIRIPRDIGSWRYFWKNTDSQFRQIDTHDKEYEKSVKKLWNKLQKIADSGIVKVTAGYRFFILDNTRNDSIPQKENLRVEIVVDKEFVNNGDYKKSSDISGIGENGKSYSYSWEEIRSLFIELNFKQLSLLTPGRLNKHTAIDKEMFSACQALDMQKIKETIDRGADVNALDDNGEGAFVYCIYAVSMSGEKSLEAIKKKTQKAISIFDYLISVGADVNLYGFGDYSPLDEAVWRNNYTIVKYLLDNGADPNRYCNTKEALYWGEDADFISSSLDIAGNIWEERYGDDNYQGKNIKAIHDLLIARGALLYTEKRMAEIEKIEQNWLRAQKEREAEIEKETLQNVTTHKKRYKRKNTRIKKWEILQSKNEQ